MRISKRAYDNIIFALSVYVFLQISVEFLVRFPPLVTRILFWIDFSICMIFLVDWFYFLYKSDRKISYASAHIFDLISAIPFAPGLRFLRLLRIFRFVRGFRGIVSLLYYFKKRPMESALVYYSIFVLLVSFYCTLGFYRYELPANPDLRSFGDVTWLTFTTMTPISYGDVHPVTTEGRLITMILVITGAVFFALLSGEIATLLIRQSKTSIE